MIKPRCPIVASAEPWAAWTQLLTVFDGSLGLFGIIKKGITWERKRNSQIISCNPGFPWPGLERRCWGEGEQFPSARWFYFRKNPEDNLAFIGASWSQPQEVTISLFWKAIWREPPGQVSQQPLRFSVGTGLGVSPGLGSGGLGSELGRATDPCGALPSHSVFGLMGHNHHWAPLWL